MDTVDTINVLGPQVAYASATGYRRVYYRHSPVVNSWSTLDQSVVLQSIHNARGVAGVSPQPGGQLGQRDALIGTSY